MHYIAHFLAHLIFCTNALITFIVTLFSDPQFHSLPLSVIQVIDAVVHNTRSKMYDFVQITQNKIPYYYAKSNSFR